MIWIINKDDKYYKEIMKNITDQYQNVMSMFSDPDTANDYWESNFSDIFWEEVVTPIEYRDEISFSQESINKYWNDFYETDY